MSERLNAWLTVLQAGQSASPAWQEAFAQCGSAAALLGASDAALGKAGLSAETLQRLRQPDFNKLQRWHTWLKRSDAGLLCRDDPQYPQRLRAVTGAPLALWLRGQRTELLDAPQLAMVGSRSADAGALSNANAFAAALGGAGLCITSGLAAGVDAAAHLGALQSTGGTLAVLGNGIDAIYPAMNMTLGEKIAEHGLIVSEYGPGTPPARHRFPARNRIIAALGFGVLVVAAGPRSGSLITARLAGDLGREIFAIPGSIHNPLARGCHQLIRQGAKLVETAQDVLVELAPMLREVLDEAALTRDDKSSDSPADELPDGSITSRPEYQALLQALGFDPTDITTITARTTLTTAEVSSMLLLLELEGHVEALPGGRYMRRQ